MDNYITKLKFRQDTAQNWSNNNPILDAGEPGYNTELGQFKIGDGIHKWNELEYISKGSGCTCGDINSFHLFNLIDEVTYENENIGISGTIDYTTTEGKSVKIEDSNFNLPIKATNYIELSSDIDNKINIKLNDKIKSDIDTIENTNSELSRLNTKTEQLNSELDNLQINVDKNTENIESNGVYLSQYTQIVDFAKQLKLLIENNRLINVNLITKNDKSIECNTMSITSEGVTTSTSPIIIWKSETQLISDNISYYKDAIIGEVKDNIIVKFRTNKYDIDMKFEIDENTSNVKVSLLPKTYTSLIDTTTTISTVGEVEIAPEDIKNLNILYLGK